MFIKMLEQFTAASPRRIKGKELDGWMGLDGAGYIADLDDGLTCIVLDITPEDATIEVYKWAGDDRVEDEPVAYKVHSWHRDHATAVKAVADIS